MVAVVVRELGPLLTAMLVLAWSGTRNVIELGTARALGEVEALEALRIDPIHYLVVPRVIGMALARVCADDLFHHRHAGQRVFLCFCDQYSAAAGRICPAIERRHERAGFCDSGA